MTRFITRRCGRIVVQVFLALTAVFILFRAAGGDPATLILGSDASTEAVRRLQHQMGLDRPLWEQYLDYLAGALHGDLGMSSSYGQPVASVIVGYVGATVTLLVVSVGLAVVVGMSAGIAAALWPQSPAARGSLLLWVVLLAVPNFWLGMVLVQIFSVNLGWLPAVSGGGAIGIILPAAAIAARLVALVARLTRATVVEVLGEEFIVTARARGVSAVRLVLVHALRPALPHVLTLIGLQSGYLLGGAVIVENLFAYQGMGQLLLAAVSQRDYTLMQGITIFFVGGFLLINLVMEIVSAKIDPRLRMMTETR